MSSKERVKTNGVAGSGPARVGCPTSDSSGRLAFISVIRPIRQRHFPKGLACHTRKELHRFSILFLQQHQLDLESTRIVCYRITAKSRLP